MQWLRLTGSLAARSMRRPRLALALAKVAWRFRHRRWYKRFPFLPVPDGAYLRWRMYTAYGNHDVVPPARDVEKYVLWSVSDS